MIKEIPAYSIGLERGLSQKFGLQLAGGYISNTLKMRPQYKDMQGFKVMAEPRLYLRPFFREDAKLVHDVKSSFYFAFSLAYAHVNFASEEIIYIKDSSNNQRTNTYRILKDIYEGSIAVGYHMGERLYIDFYGGIGVMFVNQNVSNYIAETSNTTVLSLNPYSSPYAPPVNGGYLNFPLSIRLGYSF